MNICFLFLTHTFVVAFLLKKEKPEAPKELPEIVVESKLIYVTGKSGNAIEPFCSNSSGKPRITSCTVNYETLESSVIARP